MSTVLAYKNNANDLMPVFGDVGGFDKYFRFTGPLVHRLADGVAGSFYVVIFDDAGRKNRKIKNIIALKEGEFMYTDQEYRVKILSVTTLNVSPTAKAELEGFPSARNLVGLVKILSSSVMLGSDAKFIPFDFTKEAACEIVDILALDGTVAVVVNKNDVNSHLYGAEKIFKLEDDSDKTDAPVANDYFYLEPEVAVAANIVYSMFSNPDYKGVNTMLLSGPSGYGKTAFCGMLAKKLGMDIVYFDMSLVLETEEVMGNRAIEAGSTKFQLNEFAQKVQEGNVIIVLDELNRTFAGALNALFPFLDHRGGNTFQGHDIRVGERVLFVGTRNTGLGYVGTHQSDEALLRRFQFAVNVGVLPFEEEITLLKNRTGCEISVARQIAKAAKVVRESDLGVNCPPATTLLVAAMTKFGVDPRVSFQLNLVNKIEDIEQRRGVEELLNREMGKTFDNGLLSSTFSKAF